MANYFKDRVVEHPGRVTLTPTGGTNEYDVDRAEGNVSEAGSPINAATLNTAIDSYGLWYGTSSTSASTAEKTVTCAGFTLTTGAKSAVHFTTANRVLGIIYLTVNGTGAIRVLVNDQYSNVGGSCTWDPGHVVMFSYDGSYWRIINGAIINDDELDTIETKLSLSHDGPARLYKILDKITNTSTISLTTSNSSTVYGKRYGNICSIVVDDTGVVPSGSWRDIAQLSSSSDYPSATSATVGLNGSINGFGKILVNTSGKVRVYHSIGSNQSFYGATITYIV